MITKSRKKSQNFFNCKKCLYSTSNNYDWDKHINTTKHKKITNKFPEVQEGDKIKYCHIRTPNLYQTKVISFPVKLVIL